MSSETEVAEAKRRLRAGVSATRRRLTTQQLADARESVVDVVVARCEGDAAAGRPWRTVLAYEAMSTEPGSSGLLAALVGRGCAVYSPVLLGDRDLDWVPARGGPRQGVEFAAAADAVLVPALAVDFRGMRLGRGGGSYDRVLPRVRADAVLVALLHSGEVVSRVPADAWDQPVRAVATPDGWQTLPIG